MTTFVALDFETADYKRDSACSVGLIRVEGNQIVQRAYYLIRPPRSTFHFTHVHGIRWCDVADQPTFGELWQAIEPILKDAEFLAAHNAAFDQGVLHTCCDVYGIPRPSQRFICTVQLARKTWKLHPAKLPNVCEYLGIELVHHQALSDAEACAQIVIHSQRQAEARRLPATPGVESEH